MVWIMGVVPSGWAGTVTRTAEKANGPTAGRHTFEATAFIARLVAHIPDKGQVLQRYYGYYANRGRGERRKAAEAARRATGGADAEAEPTNGADDELPLAAVPIEAPADFSRAGPWATGPPGGQAAAKAA